MLANVVRPFFASRSHNLAINNDIDVVFPFRMGTALTHFHSTHGRLLEDFGLLVHALIHYQYTYSAQRERKFSAIRAR